MSVNVFLVVMMSLQKQTSHISSLVFPRLRILIFLLDFTNQFPEDVFYLQLAATHPDHQVLQTAYIFPIFLYLNPWWPATYFFPQQHSWPAWAPWASQVSSCLNIYQMCIQCPIFLGHCIFLLILSYCCIFPLLNNHYDGVFIVCTFHTYLFG